jgi:hypothetical protein
MSEVYAGLDLGFRPSTKLFPMTAEKLLLSRVKGTSRREVLSTAVDEDCLNDLHPVFTRISLDPEERRARTAVHPSFMGGEYLPEGFAYRVVDEYMDENVNGLLEAPTSLLADRPLTLAQFGEFVVRTSRIPEICDPDRFDDLDEAQCFVRASSEFYPQFFRYVAAAIAALYPEPEPEAEDEDHG